MSNASAVSKAGDAGGLSAFALIAGIVGLVVDVTALVGIVLGFVTLPGTSIFSKSPIALAVTALFSIIYSIMLTLFFIQHRTRGAFIKLGGDAREDGQQHGVYLLSQLLWLPLFWLWAILIWNAAETANYLGFFYLVLCFFVVFGTAMGGLLIAETVIALHRYFSPQFYKPAHANLGRR